MSPRRSAGLALVLGIGALAVASLVGGAGSWLDTLATPPPVIRAVLVGGSIALGVALLIAALTRLGTSGHDDVRGLIRGLRFVFLALAAFAAAAGWVLAHPLPIVIAVVIAGIDVVETSFLLLVVGDGERG